MKQAEERSSISRNKPKPNKGLESAKAVISLLNNDPKIYKADFPRIKVIQKIYKSLMNPDEQIIYPKKSI